MALTNYAEFKNSVAHAQVSMCKAASLNNTAGRITSTWTLGPGAGAAPTTSVAPDFSSTGALYRAPTGLATWLRDAVISKPGGGTVIIYDRLVHQAGLSGTVTTAQTTNLPTAALTRNTGGVGVMAALEVYATVGTTVTTVTVSYTNSAGTAGRTSPAATFGGTSDRAVGLFMPLPLQVGDIGLKSVESVTLAASTVTAGNFGVTLWKPLAFINMPAFNQHVAVDQVRDLGALFESFTTDACLGILVGATIASNSGAIAGNINLIKQV